MALATWPAAAAITPTSFFPFTSAVAPQVPQAVYDDKAEVEDSKWWEVGVAGKYSTQLLILLITTQRRKD